MVLYHTYLVKTTADPHPHTLTLTHWLANVKHHGSSEKGSSARRQSEVANLRWGGEPEGEAEHLH